MHKMLLLSMMALLTIGTDAANARPVPSPDVQQIVDYNAQTPLTSVRPVSAEVRTPWTLAGREEEVQAPRSDREIQAPRGRDGILAPRMTADPRDEIQAPYAPYDCDAPLTDSGIQTPHGPETRATA